MFDAHNIYPSNGVVCFSRNFNVRTAVSGLNRYKIELNEGNLDCKMKFPECVSAQLAVVRAEMDNP